MPDRERPGGRTREEELEERLQALFGAIGPDGGCDDETMRRLETEHHKWPIVPHEVRQTPLERLEISRIRAEISHLILETILQCSREEAARHLVSDDNRSWLAQKEIILPSAQSVSQAIQQMEDYLDAQVVNEISRHLGVAIEMPDGMGVIDGGLANLEEKMAIEEVGPKWDLLQSKARMKNWIVFKEGLHTGQFLQYCMETVITNDDVFTLLADPYEVINNYSAETHGESGRTLKREIPREKRMTKEKLARLFQIPGLREYMVYDEEMHPAAKSSNLAIIAEYFCENDDVLFKNEITPEDIDTWLREKFEKHTPPVELAWYVWARLQGTQFEATSVFVEQYILDLIEREHGWLLEYASMPRERLTDVGGLFQMLLGTAVALRTYEKEGERYQELLSLFPSIHLLEAFVAGKTYKIDHTRAVGVFIHKHSGDFCPEITDEEIERDPNTAAYRILTEKAEIPEKWEAYEGFELLDPLAIQWRAKMNRGEGLGSKLQKVMKEVEKMTPKQLLKFKEDVIDRLEGPRKERALVLFRNIAHRSVAQTCLVDRETGELVELARGTQSPGSKKLILPGNVDFEKLVGEKLTSEHLSGMAELAVLSQGFKGARGEQEIISFLMSHLGTMRPSELVLPFEDSANRDIIRDYAESPDLLSLTQMATLLAYCGRTPDEVMREVSMQAELASAQARPELVTIGAELEQVGATADNTRLITGQYNWLYNILAEGNDTKSNELITSPTASPVMQNLLLRLISDQRFGFLTEGYWDAVRQSEGTPSSIHVTAAIPRDIPFSPELTVRIIQPVLDLQWLAYGGDKEQRRIARGKVGPWYNPYNVLDVFNDKSGRQKIEARNLALEEDGSHMRNIEQLQVLISAGIQYMREQSGLKLTPSARVMAQIYETFTKEAKVVMKNPEDQNVQVAAQALLERFALEVESELNIIRQAKTEGIVTV